MALQCIDIIILAHFHYAEFRLTNKTFILHYEIQIMSVKLNTIVMMISLPLALSMVIFDATSKESQQSILDKACEDARQEALKPRRLEIYNECRDKFKKSEEVCKRDAQAFNGRRIGGAPMFYDLPACVEAFNYNKKHNS